jgi:hypothetical protein
MGIRVLIRFFVYLDSNSGFAKNIRFLSDSDQQHYCPFLSYSVVVDFGGLVSFSHMTTATIVSVIEWPLLRHIIKKVESQPRGGISL